MKKYSHHKYTWSKPFGTGASQEWSSGLELHSNVKQPNVAPSHLNCWLTKQPCWHDGTSLYAQETLWPMIEPILKSGDHEAIFRILEREADNFFTKEEAQ